MHGPKGSVSKPSEYARQLREKQKLKRIYGVTERQLGNYFTEASKAKEITGNALLKILEARLDNVIYRSGFAKTRAQGRQMVGHGAFKVNGQKVTIPSFHVNVGDKFEVVDRLKKSKLFAELDKQKYGPAKWINVDYTKLNGEVARSLEQEDLDKAVQTSLVVEYYSK